MTAARSPGGGAHEHQALAEDATPDEIRARLLPEDGRRFAAEYEAALDASADGPTSPALVATLDRWRAWALLQSDQSDFSRLVRTAAERLTGEPVPPNEPLAITRRRIGW